MNFVRLFVYFNDCGDSSKIEIDDKDAVIIHASPIQRIKAWFSPKKEENQKTVSKITQLLEDWRDFKNLNENDRKEILAELKVIKDCGSEHLQLEVGKVREIYRRVISKQFTGFETVACCHSFSKRVVKGPTDIKVHSVLFGFYSAKERLENAETIKAYRDGLYTQFGQQRVERVLRAHNIDFEKRIKDGGALYVEDVHKMTTGLADVHFEDVQSCYSTIKAAIELLMDEKLECLPEKVKKGLISSKNRPTLLESLRLRFEHVKGLPDMFIDLPKSEIKYLIDLHAIPPEDLEKHLLGNRVEGVTQGHRPLFSPYRYFYSKHFEDSIRIQAAQEVMEYKGSNPLFYLELWTKLFIKTEGSYWIDILTDMIVPGPNGEWYRIHKMESDRGKFVLCLDHMTDSNMPSLIIQRSTASSPSASNSAWTLLQDSNPLAPPGYYHKELCLNTEFNHFMKGTNPLIITGHSLGGSFTQLNLINFIKKMEKESLKFPNRQVSLVLFDTPAISKEDADYFAKWAKENPDEAKKIAIEYYISKPDNAPGAGHCHLGVGCEDTHVSVKFVLVDTVADNTVPELLMHPHGRFFFRSKETIANSIFEEKGAKELKAYDDQWWRFCIEIVRRLLGCVIYPTLRAWLALKQIYQKFSDTFTQTDLKVDRAFKATRQSATH